MDRSFSFVVKVIGDGEKNAHLSKIDGGLGWEKKKNKLSWLVIWFREATLKGEGCRYRVLDNAAGLAVSSQGRPKKTLKEPMARGHICVKLGSEDVSLPTTRHGRNTNWQEDGVGETDRSFLDGAESEG